MLSEEEFVKGMAVLAAHYPDYKMTPATVDVYRERLCFRLDPKVWEAAINHHIDTCKWFPKVCELLQAVRDLNPLPSPIEVWNRLLAAAEDGKEPQMDSATRQAVNFIGGWHTICFTPIDQHRFMFAGFKSVFLAAQDVEQRQQIGQSTAPQLEG